MQWWKFTHKPRYLARIHKNLEHNRFAFHLVLRSGRSSSRRQGKFNLREIQKRDSKILCDLLSKVEKTAALVDRSVLIGSFFTV